MEWYLSIGDNYVRFRSSNGVSMFFSKKKVEECLTIQERQSILAGFLEQRIEQVKNLNKEIETSLSKEPKKIELVLNDGSVKTLDFYDTIEMLHDEEYYSLDEKGRVVQTYLSYSQKPLFLERAIIRSADQNRVEFINQLQSNTFVDIENNGKLINVNNILEIRKL